MEVRKERIDYGGVDWGVEEKDFNMKNMWRKKQKGKGAFIYTTTQMVYTADIVRVVIGYFIR